jgi:hypothetical protein
MSTFCICACIAITCVHNACSNMKQRAAVCACARTQAHADSHTLGRRMQREHRRLRHRARQYVDICKRRFGRRSHATRRSHALGRAVNVYIHTSMWRCSDITFYLAIVFYIFWSHRCVSAQYVLTRVHVRDTACVRRTTRPKARADTLAAVSAMNGWKPYISGILMWSACRRSSRRRRSTRTSARGTRRPRRTWPLYAPFWPWRAMLLCAMQRSRALHRPLMMAVVPYVHTYSNIIFLGLVIILYLYMYCDYMCAQCMFEHETTRGCMGVCLATGPRRLTHSHAAPISVADYRTLCTTVDCVRSARRRSTMRRRSTRTSAHGTRRP